MGDLKHWRRVAGQAEPRIPKSTRSDLLVRHTLGSILESAVALSWADLLEGHRPGSIHVEYAFSPEGTINTLKLWLSTVRGHWRLIGGLGTELNGRIQFADGYRNADLASNLEFILHHQTSFSPLENYGRAGLLQIKNPTQEEIDIAAVAMKTARSFVDSISTPPATA
jgi:hypothetical protein